MKYYIFISQCVWHTVIRNFAKINDKNIFFLFQMNKNISMLNKEEFAHIKEKNVLLRPNAKTKLV